MSFPRIESFRFPVCEIEKLNDDRDDNAQLRMFITKSLDGGETASESDVRVRALAARGSLKRVEKQGFLSGMLGTPLPVNESF